MDELTRERYPHGLPVNELRRQPSRVPKQRTAPEPPPGVIRKRQLILCGTTDVDVMEILHAIAEERHLVRAIRRHWASA